MPSTFNSYSFGCRVNLAEKEELDRQLIQAGFKYKDNNPDFYLINTCAVTQKAERETRQLIYQTKRKWPDVKIVVTGCAATKWIHENTKVDDADLIVDNVNKEYIASLINSKFNPTFLNPDGIPRQAQDDGVKSGFKYPDKFLNSGRLFVKIQDGCQRFCTFCIVPYLRGQSKSIRIKNLELRIKNYGNDIKEVILTAINTQAYGFDTDETFLDLVKAIIRNTKVPRISFGSIHPWSFDDGFLKYYKDVNLSGKLIKFFHIPLQSGSNKILSLMKRNYTREEFIEKLSEIEKIEPMTFIGTDIIVGFLEETDKDFAETYDFLKKSPISKFHVFRFSKREKTAAYFMAKRLTEPSLSDKSKRSITLIELGRKKYNNFLRKHIGKSFPALFLQKREENFQETLLDNQIPALIATDKDLRCEIKNVKIDKMYKNRLIGKLA